MDKQVNIFSNIDKSTVGSDALSRYQEELRLSGYTLIPNVISPADCGRYKDAIYHVYQQQVDEFGGLERLQQINDIGVCRHPFFSDDSFVSLMKISVIDELVKASVANPYVLNVQRGLINAPEETIATRSWHRDHPYQNFITSRPVSLTAIYLLDPSTTENGGVEVIPGSESWTEMPHEDYFEKHKKHIAGQQGDVIIIDSMLFHRTTQNRSDKDRVAFVQLFTHPMIKQSLDYTALLDGKYQDDAILSSMLGYKTQTDSSDLAYRTRKLSKRVNEY